MVPPGKTVSRPRLRSAGWTVATTAVFVLSCLPLALLAWSGTDEGTGKREAVWGRRGISQGRLQKPRAMAIDADDNVYVVDMTARIQVFDRELHQHFLPLRTLREYLIRGDIGSELF